MPRYTVLERATPYYTILYYTIRYNTIQYVRYYAALYLRH